MGSEFINADGTLVNPQAYVSAGVISPFAYFQIRVLGGDPAKAHTASISLNGQSLTTLTIPIEAIGMNGPIPYSFQECLEEDISNIRFAQRNVAGDPGDGNDSACAARNGKFFDRK